MAFKGLREGDDGIVDRYEKTLGIKSFQAFFENGPQVILQMYTIILGWNDEERGGQALIQNMCALDITYYFHNRK